MAPSLKARGLSIRGQKTDEDSNASLLISQVFIAHLPDARSCPRLWGHEGHRQGPHTLGADRACHVRAEFRRKEEGLVFPSKDTHLRLKDLHTGADAGIAVTPASDNGEHPTMAVVRNSQLFVYCILNMYHCP